MTMATSGAISDDEYAVLCGAIFICLLLCSIFVLAGFISRSAHRDEHAAPLSAERLRAFGANTFRSCTCCPGGISDGLCNARQSVSRHASHATHHKAPVLAGRKTIDPGDHPASAGPQAAPRDGLSRRFNMARYSSGGGEYPDPSLGRYERADCPSAAALVALRYSCTSSSSTSQAKQPEPATRRQAASNRAVRSPMPLAALAAAATAATLRSARGSGLSRASDADSDGSHMRRGGSGSGVDTGFLQRLDEALSNGALRPGQATQLLRDVGFDLDQLLIDELAAK
eukprot:XP_001699026.1 predicted protein [Chlamydomonas reinhardtii]